MTATVVAGPKYKTLKRKMNFGKYYLIVDQMVIYSFYIETVINAFHRRKELHIKSGELPMELSKRQKLVY